MSSPTTIGTAISSTNNLSVSQTQVIPTYSTGQTLIAFGVGAGTGGTSAKVSIADNVSNIWTQLATFSPIQDGQALNFWLSCYICVNATAGATVTATNAGSVPTAVALVVLPLGKTQTVSYVDGAGQGSGSSSGATVTTSSWAQSFGAGDLTIAGFFTAGASGTAPSGYTVQKTQQLGTTGDFITVLTNPSQNTTPESASMTVSTGHDWMGIGFAIIAAPPTVTACTPSSGTTAGGTAITNLAGTNFFATPTITFGGGSATSVAFTSSTQLTCTTPSHAAGLVAVTVTNPDGQSGTGNVFTYTSAGGAGRELCLLGAGT